MPQAAAASGGLALLRAFFRSSQSCNIKGVTRHFRNGHECLTIFPRPTNPAPSNRAGPNTGSRKSCSTWRPRLPSSEQPTFTLTLPPPNVTGNLHMGHMLEHTEIDIIVRWKRMQRHSDAVAAGHRPCRHRDAVDGGAAAGVGGQEPPRHDARGVRRARLGVEEALRRRHSRSR